MSQRVTLEVSYQKYENKPDDYDFFANVEVGGEEIYLSLWSVLYDPNDPPESEYDRYGGNDYFKRSVVNVHYGEPPDYKDRPVDAQFSYYGRTSESVSAPWKYWKVTLSDDAAVPPHLIVRHNEGSEEPLSNSFFSYNGGVATGLWSSLSISASPASELSDAAWSVARNTAQDLGLSDTFNTIEKIDSLRSTLTNRMDAAFEVLDYGITNFESLDPHTYERQVKDLFRETERELSEELANQAGVPPEAARLLQSFNMATRIGEGPVELSISIGDSIASGGAGVVIISGEVDLSTGEASKYVGSDEKEVVISRPIYYDGKLDTSHIYTNSPLYGFSLNGGNDTFIGNAYAEAIALGNGNDWASTGSGWDVVRAGRGDDVAYLGFGADRAVGGGGADIFYGGKGRDSLNGSSGNDRLYGQAGRDTLEGRNGKDVLMGGSGHDSLKGGAGKDALGGGGGRDKLVGGQGEDSLEGGSGRDRLFGGASPDWLYGNLGNDNLKGGNGDDYLSGGKGRDHLTGGNGYDTFQFQHGDDRNVIRDFDIDQDFIYISRGASSFSQLTFSGGSNGTVISFRDVEIFV